VSLHIPLLDATHHIINESLLKLMKKGSLLVNTARGPILNFNDLLRLLETAEISVNLAFDVYENEPLEEKTLRRFQKIAEKNPQLKFIFIPHNASADADTRAQMAIMLLEDIISLANSSSAADLNGIRLIPESKNSLFSSKENGLKISLHWDKK
jgi:glyoxylate reductase